MLAYKDSSSALGWLFKASFKVETHECHDKVACQLALYSLHREQALFPRYITGENNVIADILSRDTHLDNVTLTSLCSIVSPRQTPKTFTLVPAHIKIIYWISSLMDKQTSPKESPKPPQPSTEGKGRGVNRWRRFLTHVGIVDGYLINRSREQKITLLSAFAPVVRRNFDGRPKK